MNYPAPAPSPAMPATRWIQNNATALALGIALCWSASAGAQVVRCTDPATGKVTYTDGDCRRGEAAREVEARKSPQEVAQERAQAAEALERKHERQQHEDRQRQEAARAESHLPPPGAGRNTPAHSADCQRARRNLQDTLATLGQGMYDEQSRLEKAQRQADLACLSPADYARAERSRGQRAEYSAPYSPPPMVGVPPRPFPVRPMPPPPRREIANCNVFRCYDAQGNPSPR